MSGPVVNHVGQCVRDLEASKRFYVEALGFTEWFGMALPDDPSSTLLSLDPPVGMTVAYLHLDGFVLELLAFDKALEQRPARVMNELGLTHLSVSVDDIPATVARVCDLGGAVVSDIGLAVMVADPDGQRLELLPAGYRAKLPPLPAS